MHNFQGFTADLENVVDYGFLDRISDFAYYFVRIVVFILRSVLSLFRKEL